MRLLVLSREVQKASDFESAIAYVVVQKGNEKTRPFLDVTCGCRPVGENQWKLESLMVPFAGHADGICIVTRSLCDRVSSITQTHFANSVGLTALCSAERQRG